MLGRGLIIAFITVLIDQGVKYFFLEYLQVKPGYNFEVFPFFNLVMVWNSGISFGMFSEASWAPTILPIAAIIISLILLFWMYHAATERIAESLGMIIGGAIGNIIDRFQYGQVADFFDFHLFSYHWPAFNIADAAICLGAFLFLIENISHSRQKKRFGQEKKKDIFRNVVKLSQNKRFLLLLTIALISGCSGSVGESLGIVKRPPDEFMVLSRPPLSLPPEFNLRPPGSKYENAATTTSAPIGKVTSGEASLLGKVEANKANPNIRELLDKDASPIVLPEEKGFFSQILDDIRGTKEEPVVKPFEERQRIEENKKQGKSVTEGETPSSKPSQNIFKRIFD